MNRPTRVPASTAVRMNSASNMIAKWYQNACRFPPKAVWKISEMPTASVGAPPVREIRLGSWTAAEAAARSWAEVEKPRPLMKAAAVSGVPPVAPAGAFIAKYRPWSMTTAAMSALMATKDSISMPP
jgi:hypothetical protein